MTLLSVNAGSSSLKVAVFDDSQIDTPTTSVSIEGIGSANSCIIPNGVYGSSDTKNLPIANHTEAANLIRQWLEDEQSISSSSIKAIGHRVVHGGPKYNNAAIVDDQVIQYLEDITPLAPNHMPATLSSLRSCISTFPDAVHVVVFDTGFFHDIPTVAQTLPIPKKLQDELSMRRFGFHGLSYQSLLDSFKKREGVTAANGRVIMAHLGSGASVTACRNGKPLDMSMGFTPVSGIMMSTRTGDIEPGVITYLQNKKGLSPDAINDLATHQSGLLGISGTTADMYTLLQTQRDNPDSKLAIDMFCYKIKKQIGAYVAVLDGVDSIIFSGGIGERSAEIRGRILSDLSYIGIKLDEVRNNANERLISTDDSAVGVHVIQAREDSSIIQQTKAVVEREII